MIRLAGTRASRAVRSTTRCHSASVSGGISGSTVVTAAVPMTNAAGPDRLGTGTPRYRHTHSGLGLDNGGCHAFARSRGIWEEYLN